jgi:hypothetical protein
MVTPPGLQLVVSDLMFGMGQRAVMDDRNPVAMTRLNVAINGIPAPVQNSIAVPFIKRLFGFK